MEQNLTEIQQAINSILNVKSLIRRKKKTQLDKKRELFLSIINSIETIITRQNLMYMDMQLDFSKYDEPFLDTIDGLIIMLLGKEGAEIVNWYLWERLNPDGTLNYLRDSTGQEFTINNPGELWEVLLQLNSKLNG
jgi:hypothetical protein